MKKLLLSFAVIALTTLLLVSACKKSNDKAVTNEQTTSMSFDGVENQQRGVVAQFYNSYGPQPRKYTIDAARQTTISLPSGGRITIPAGAFAIGGVPVSSGIVEVSVLDLPSRGSMAMRGVNTMVGGQVLESNGNFNLEATANGKTVDANLSQGRMLRVEVPDRIQNGNPLNLFVGGSNSQNQFDWVPVQVTGQPNNIPVSSSGTFTFNWPRTGWCNPDWFLRNIDPGTTYTKLDVNLIADPGMPATYLGGTGNTVVLFVPQGRNVIIQLYIVGGIATSTNNYIPVGINGRLLAYSITPAGAYMATKDIVTTAANPIVESLTFAPTTAAALSTALTALSTY